MSKIIEHMAFYYIENQKADEANKEDDGIAKFIEILKQRKQDQDG